VSAQDRPPDGRPLVLYVIQQREFSGAETLMIPVLRSDPAPLLACPPGSGVERWARGLGVPTVPLPFRTLRHSGGALETVRSLGRGVRSALDLRAALRAHPERDVVCATSLRPGMLVGLAALGLGRRALWLVPDFMPPAPVRWITRGLALATCDRAIAISDGIAADFAGRWGRLRRRTVRVYPGLDVERFEEPAQGARPARAAVVGHVSPTKRTDLAIDVAERVIAQEPSFELEILGRALYRDEDFAFEQRLKDRVAADDRLARRITFRGQVDDVAAELRRFALLLHTRPDEPLGMALIEAMAAGLPVVAPGAAGPTEIVEHGVTGFLFDPARPEDAARHVVALLRDPATARTMGAAGRRRVRDVFSVDGQVAGFEAVLASLARGGPA
jgi:glycosyltransferase involved in cell wall biosynthesis